jgi:CubicO group peptidase (beta-lactamase class C family)
VTLQKRRAALKGLLAGALSPLMPGCAAPPSRPAGIALGDFSKVVAYLQALITHEMQAQNLTGLSIAVVDGQRLTWTQGFGWADRAAGIPAGSDTVYRVGSVSKLFTVAAALQFAERGQLDLDAPLNRVLPEFRTGSRFGQNAITPRQLMTHHAGLPRDLLRGMWCQTPETGFQAVLDHLANSEPAYPPGEVWSYSNLGLSVLGAAVERLAGAPFADHMQRALLQPLGMETASFTGPLPTSPYLSKAYADGEEATEPGLRDIAAGGLNASVRDLGRWLMMHFAQGRSGGRSVLREASVAEMLRVQNEAVALDFDLKMGLGWMLTPPAGRLLPDVGPVASHGGATVNHRSLIVALPQHQLGVAILCNSANARTLEQLAETTLVLMLEARTGHRQPDATPAPPWRAANLPESALADYAGEYVTPAGAVRVSTDGPRLRAQTPGLRFTLVPDSEGALHVRKELFGLLPLPLGDLDQLSFLRQTVAGRRVLVAQRGATRMLFGEQLDPLRDPPTYPAWRDMLGVYLPETGADEFPLIERLTLFEADSMLNLRPSLRKSLIDEPSGALRVQTLSQTLGIVADKLARRGETLAIRVRDGKKTLQFAGYTFRKLIA